jgi:TATA-box binding protein (TBP) (component of TFIID and TFIIIB)
MNTFEYIQSLSEIRKGLTGGELPDPSWVRITTITMCSKFLEDIDLPKFRENFKKLETVTVRRKGSKFGGFEWRMADTAFYNQVTIGYRDAYSRKSIKIFPNGSIQVAGCSDLFDCRRILRQLSFILKVVLGREHDIPVDKVDIKMINTNFSLNSSVNLNKIIVALGSSANQARINYLDERIEFMESIYKERNLIGYDQDGYAMEEDGGIIPEKKAELNNLIEERQSLEEKMPYGKFKVTYDPDRYSAVKVKFVPGEGMKQVTASIFSTGKIIVTGAQTLTEIAQAYSILNQNLRDPAIYVKTVSTPETFDTILGAKFDEWVTVLERTNKI